MLPTRLTSPQASEKSKSFASGEREFTTLLSVVTVNISLQSGQKWLRRLVQKGLRKILFLPCIFIGMLLFK
jgi:hypothetical protein